MGLLIIHLVLQRELETRWCGLSLAALFFGPVNFHTTGNYLFKWAILGIAPEP